MYLLTYLLITYLPTYATKRYYMNFFAFFNPNRPIPSFLSCLVAKIRPKQTLRISHIKFWLMCITSGDTGKSPEVCLVDPLPSHGTLLAPTRALGS
jgi:hypothetical protein